MANGPPTLTLSSQLVVWVLGVAGTATVLFWSWVGITLIGVQVDVNNLRDQRMDASISARQEVAAASALIAERLSILSVRVGRIEDQVERLRYGHPPGPPKEQERMQ